MPGARDPAAVARSASDATDDTLPPAGGGSSAGESSDGGSDGDGDSDSDRSDEDTYLDFNEADVWLDEDWAGVRITREDVQLTYNSDDDSVASAGDYGNPAVFAGYYEWNDWGEDADSHFDRLDREAAAAASDSDASSGIFSDDDDDAPSGDDPDKVQNLEQLRRAHEAAAAAAASPAGAPADLSPGPLSPADSLAATPPLGARADPSASTDFFRGELSLSDSDDVADGHDGGDDGFDLEEELARTGLGTSTSAPRRPGTTTAPRRPSLTLPPTERSPDLPPSLPVTPALSSAPVTPALPSGGDDDCDDARLRALRSPWSPPPRSPWSPPPPPPPPPRVTAKSPPHALEIPEMPPSPAPEIPDMPPSPALSPHPSLDTPTVRALSVSPLFAPVASPPPRPADVPSPVPAAPVPAPPPRSPAGTGTASVGDVHSTRPAQRHCGRCAAARRRLDDVLAALGATQCSTAMAAAEAAGIPRAEHSENAMAHAEVVKLRLTMDTVARLVLQEAHAVRDALDVNAAL